MYLNEKPFCQRKSIPLPHSPTGLGILHKHYCNQFAAFFKHKYYFKNTNPQPNNTQNPQQKQTKPIFT